MQWFWGFSKKTGNGVKRLSTSEDKLLLKKLPRADQEEKAIHMQVKDTVGPRWKAKKELKGELKVD